MSLIAPSHEEELALVRHDRGESRSERDASIADDRPPDDACGVESGTGLPDPTKRPFHAVELLPVGVIGLLAPVLLLRMVPFTRPVVYTQDVFQHLALARTANWFGTPGTTRMLDAPYGLDWGRSIPTGTERLHVVVLKTFDVLTGGNPYLTLNLTVLVGVTATILVGYVVLRWLGVHPLLSGAAAVTFAFSPALTDRLGAGHLFLFPLYPVALGVYLAVLGSRRVGSRDPSNAVVGDAGPARNRFGRWGVRTLILPGLAVVVVATSSVYYATFTVLLVLSLGLIAAARSGSLRRLLLPLLIVTALGSTMALTLLPDMLARVDSPTAGGFNRSVQDSDRYGMRIAQMLLPMPSTQIPFVGRVADRAYWTESTGDFGVSIGPLAVVGLIAIAWTSIRRLGRPGDDADRTIERFAALILAAVVLATVGAGGLLLASLGFTQTRVWSRMAAFIGFAALAGLALVVQRRFGSRRMLAVWVLAVVALGLVEHPLRSSAAPIDRAVREDASLVSSMEATLPQGAAVFELPVVPFPDDVGSQRLLAPSLTSRRLRFSAGEFKGGAGDWQQSWMSGDLGDATFLAAVAGFDGLLVQTSHALVGDPDDAIRRIAGAAGVHVWRSADGGWAWVDLRPLRRRLERDHGRRAVTDAGGRIIRPLGFTFGDWRLTSWVHDSVRQQLGPNGSIDVHPVDGDPAPVQVSFRVGAADGASVEVTAPGAAPVRVRPDADGSLVHITVPRVDDASRVAVRSNRGEGRFDGGTPASVWVSDVRVRDVRGIGLVEQLR